jgi:glycosyltransferase involved in cell wall biosynthesis
MRKICHLTSVHNRYDNRIFYKECSSLAQAGYNTNLIVADEKGNEEKNNIRILDVGISKGGRFARTTKTVWSIYRKALRVNAEIYHLHDPELLWLVPFFALHRKTVLFDMHENFSKQMLSKHWVPKFLRKILSWFVLIIGWIVIRNIPVVYAEKSYAKDYPWVKQSIQLLNLPIIYKFNKNLPHSTRPPKVGYIGGVSEKRGSVVTINALNILSKNMKVTWECVGPITIMHQKELNNITAPEVLPNINFYGRMNSSEGLKIISSCNIGIALLHPIPNYVESYPTKMFEYMMLGLPVIVSAFPLYQDIVEGSGCGICVDPFSKNGIAEAIRWIINHPIEAEQMGKNGLRAVEGKFNWNLEEKKLLALYEKLLL